MSKQETPLDFMLGMTHEEFEHWVWCGEHNDENVVELHKEALRLRKELEEARKALKEIAEHGGVNLRGASCAELARAYLGQEGEGNQDAQS